MIPQPAVDQPARGGALGSLCRENEAIVEELERNKIALIGYLPNTMSMVAVSKELEDLLLFQRDALANPVEVSTCGLREAGRGAGVHGD